MLRDEEYYEDMNFGVTTGVFVPAKLRGFLIVLIGLCFLFTFLQSYFLSGVKVERKFIYEAIIQSNYIVFLGLLIVIIILYHRIMAIKFQALQFLLFICLMQILGFQFLLLAHLSLARFFDEDINLSIILLVIISGFLLLLFSIFRFRSSIAKGRYIFTKEKDKIRDSNSKLIKPLGVCGLGLGGASMVFGNNSPVTGSMLFLLFTLIFYIQMYYLPYLFTVAMCKIKFQSFRV
ncbi:hypothetical protein [Priestia taiwanensis]|uniref:Uncharacterized protein n=1 Tax=Priestia taiwanensis TaxID=1347902 RepID=A0A917AIY7_9BACI|nr:hypothetical protein [Priestia taiwanensis]MBM7361581.1 hypothetical protein [Priestia taiwanensis]GGE55294.1 hypothetical protein GCM10007140_02050 [Priestia taiwanensis]